MEDLKSEIERLQRELDQASSEKIQSVGHTKIRNEFTTYVNCKWHWSEILSKHSSNTMCQCLKWAVF